MKQTGKPLSELAAGMPKVPADHAQCQNGKAHEPGGLRGDSRMPYPRRNPSWRTGRVVLAGIGTEPVIRVMVEGEDAKQVVAIATRLAERRRGGRRRCGLGQPAESQFFALICGVSPGILARLSRLRDSEMRDIPGRRKLENEWQAAQQMPSWCRHHCRCAGRSRRSLAGLPAVSVPRSVAGARGGIGSCASARRMSRSTSSGAYTGEVAVRCWPMLAARYVIVGHSERRSLYGESSEQVARSLGSAGWRTDADTVRRRNARGARGRHDRGAVIDEQLDAVLDANGIAAFASA